MNIISLLSLLSFSIGIYGDEDEATVKYYDSHWEPEEPTSDESDSDEFSFSTRSTIDLPLSSLEIITGDVDCKCGKPRTVMSGRIVGGVLAKINDLPWTAAIVDKRTGRVFCGATLISDTWVITASHCMDSLSAPEKLQIYLMEQDFEDENENAEPTLKLDVEQVVVHPEYNRKKMRNDITLIKLKTPVNIQTGEENAMIPACLPSNMGVSFAGEEATVAGWGATEYGRPVVSKLRRLKVPIFNQTFCLQNTRYKKILTEDMLCAGFIDGKQDACQGDSGGPLVLELKDRYVLVGVVSFGYECARPNAPGIYVRTSQYSKWIRDVTKGSKFCNR